MGSTDRFRLSLYKGLVRKKHYYNYLFQFPKAFHLRKRCYPIFLVPDISMFYPISVMSVFFQ